MYFQPPVGATKKWLVRIGLIIGWSSFVILAVLAIARIRNIPEWQNFLTFQNPQYPSQAIVFDASPTFIRSTVQLSYQPTNRAPTATPSLIYGAIKSATNPTSARIPSGTPQPTFTSVPPIPTPALTVLSYPTICAQSLPTRFHPGQRGQTVSGSSDKLRDTPSSANGTALTPQTQFQVTGGSVCAYPYQNISFQLLWWPVELLNGQGVRKSGWIAESVRNGNGESFYNIEPIGK